MDESSSNRMSRNVEDFLQIFRKGEEFTKDLLKENERLRLRAAQVEGMLEKSGDEEKLSHYKDRINDLEDELSSISEKFEQVSEENKNFADKYVEVEEENNNLANLYVASYQLHSTLDFDEVLRIVLEIIINLIGAEKFAVYLIDEKTNELIPVASEGVELDVVPRLKIGEGIPGKVVKDAESYFADDIDMPSEDPFINPIVGIPLKIKEHVIGAIAIYALFVQKEKFTNVDHELFHLLAGHAATAIFSSRLYTQSERKLTTLQSFLDLLRDKPKNRR